MQISEYEEKSLNKLGEAITAGKWSNAGLVQLIELSGGFLNIRTLAEYAKQENLSYNGAKKCREVIKILGIKFIIDNE